METHLLDTRLLCFSLLSSHSPGITYWAEDFRQCLSTRNDHHQKNADKGLSSSLSVLVIPTERSPSLSQESPHETLMKLSLTTDTFRAGSLRSSFHWLCATCRRDAEDHTQGQILALPFLTYLLLARKDYAIWSVIGMPGYNYITRSSH